MKRSRSLLNSVALVVGASMFCIGALLITSWLYTTNRLQVARTAGVFPSAEAGMRNLIAKNYVEPYDYQIIYAGPNSFDGSSPYVWYVIACVWGGHRADGSTVGSERHDYDQPGSFFLNAKEGWVFIPEGAFPGFMGFWMEVFNLAGPGSSQPTHDWDSSPQGECTF